MATSWDGTRMIEQIPGVDQKYWYKYGGRIMYNAEIVLYNDNIHFRDTKGEEDSMPCMFKLPEGVPRTAENIISRMEETEQMIKFTNHETFLRAAFWTSRLRIIEYSLPVLPYWVNTERLLTLSVAGDLVDGKPIQIKPIMEELTAIKFLEIQEPFSFYEGLQGMRYGPISLSHVEVYVKCAKLPALMRLRNFPFGRFELTFNISELCTLTEEDLTDLIPQPEIMDLRIRIDFKENEHDENSTFDLDFVENLFPFIARCFPRLSHLMIHFTTCPPDVETCFAEATRLHEWASQVNPTQRMRFDLHFREYAEISEVDILEYTAFGYELGTDRNLPPDTLSIVRVHPRVTVYHNLTFSDRVRTVRPNANRDTPSPMPSMAENAVILDTVDPVPPEMVEDYNDYLVRKGLMEPAAVEPAAVEAVAVEAAEVGPDAVENPDVNDEAPEREASPAQNEAEASNNEDSPARNEPEKVDRGARKAEDDDEDQPGPSKRAKI
uniref:FTH domain-containing protein n=1 Tax=Panagrellus redivivus TaxID=6233 RepID=A0A7E4VTU1_PANRE